MDNFHRFRPSSHFIAPHSWSNDPCGAVFIPETQEYLLCYQWNPGTTAGGNCAWGMAKSRDLVTWEDCPPPIWNGPTYDCQGVFSGSIESKVLEGKRILLLYYTSVSALPIHWSKPYIDSCETQSVAISTDLGQTWERYAQNPVLKDPPQGSATTGWRDPFVSRWASLSRLLGADASTRYMLIASGERHQGPQLRLYQSDDLLSWDYLSILFEHDSSDAAPTSNFLRGAVNFECASFFTLEGTDYIIVGVEEEDTTLHHNGHHLVWMSGSISLQSGRPRFEVSSHGSLDHGVLYAAHIFRDAQDKIVQFGWADETCSAIAARDQGWAGCIGLPRELHHVTSPATASGLEYDAWTEDTKTGLMSTLGVRPARQVLDLRNGSRNVSLADLSALRSLNFEISAKFKCLRGTETFEFGVRASSDSQTSTRVSVDLASELITVSSQKGHCECRPQDSGRFTLLPGEELDVRLFVDNSIIEVFVNERFALTSRVYSSPVSCTRVFVDFGDFEISNIEFACWDGLRRAWPGRDAGEQLLEELHPFRQSTKQGERVTVEELPRVAEVQV